MGGLDCKRCCLCPNSQAMKMGASEDWGQPGLCHPSGGRPPPNPAIQITKALSLCLGISLGASKPRVSLGQAGVGRSQLV